MCHVTQSLVEETGVLEEEFAKKKCCPIFPSLPQEVEMSCMECPSARADSSPARQLWASVKCHGPDGPDVDGSRRLLLMSSTQPLRCDSPENDAAKCSPLLQTRPIGQLSLGACFSVTAREERTEMNVYDSSVGLIEPRLLHQRETPL